MHCDHVDIASIINESEKKDNWQHGDHRVKIEDIHMSDIDQRVIFSSVATHGHIC